MGWTKLERARYKILQVIVPKTEAKIIERAAQRDRLPVSRFCRQMIMQQLDAQDGGR